MHYKVRPIGAQTFVKVLGLLATGLAICSGPFAAQTTELPKSLGDAINAVSAQSSDQWAYTRETQDDIGHYVERFDPALKREEQWTLLLVEDKAPTKKHLERYQKEYGSLFERDSPTDVDLATLMNPASAMLVSEVGDIQTYTFVPLADDDEDASIVENLSGEIVINKRSNSVLSVDIQNSREFSPASMLKITELSLSLEFQSVADGALNFVSASSETTKGRFMGIKRFAEAETVEFREFADRQSGTVEPQTTMD